MRAFKPHKINARADKQLVLFVCEHNAGRSQIAQAIASSRYGDTFDVVSAGTKPGKAVWPEVRSVLAAEGMSETLTSPKHLTQEMLEKADYIVTMGCGDLSGEFDMTRLRAKHYDFPTEDPKGKPEVVVLSIKNDIEQRIVTLLGEKKMKAKNGDIIVAPPKGPKTFGRFLRYLLGERWIEGPDEALEHLAGSPRWELLGKHLHDTSTGNTGT